VSFERAIAKVLEHEGGYIHDPDDPGGETHWGITKRSYPDLDIKRLSREDAVTIYWRDWWEKYGYGTLPESIGEKLLDLSVNVGASRAHKLLQQALRACEWPVDVDGKLGPVTRRAVATVPTFALLAALRSEAAGYYRELIARQPARAKWERGWISRAYA